MLDNDILWIFMHGSKVQNVGKDGFQFLSNKVIASTIVRLAAFEKKKN